MLTLGSAKKLNNCQDLLMSAELLNHTQYITCYVMCDGIAGTTRSAELRPELPAHSFPPPSSQKQAQQHIYKKRDTRSFEDISDQQGASTFHTSPETLEDDEFGADDFKDQEVMNAVKNMDFSHIDEFDPRSKQNRLKPSVQESRATGTEQILWNPERLENGKWACNHKCKDKTVCKHMCCREGVDKAPKPPKRSFVSAASLVDASHVSGHRDKSGHITTAKKSAASRELKNETEAEIETVDLASRHTSRGYGKAPPEAFRSLNCLHDNVTKGRTAPVAIKKQPLFDYAKGEQPQDPFLHKDASAEISSEKPSTDYDADWMGDLPSPSACLGNPQEKDGTLTEHTSTEYGSSWPDGLPSPSAIIRQKNSATGGYPENDLLEGFDLSRFNDDESDLEAAMVGLSDSATMQQDSQVQAAEASSHWSPAADEPSPKLHHHPTFKAESSGTSKPVLSTDSPAEVAELGQKRKAAMNDEAEDVSQSAPASKRPRVSSSAEKQVNATSSIVKAGQPAWVYGFDAAFIAEWQDIVEFV